MPIYEYRCQACGKVFEVLHRRADEDLAVVCPGCDSLDIARLMSRFSGKIGNASSSSCSSCAATSCGSCGH